MDMAPRVRNTGEDLALLVEAATAAGREALKFFRNDVQVWWKNGGSSEPATMSGSCPRAT